MSDLAERIRAIGEQVDAGYDAGRTEVALSGLRTNLRRRRARRMVLGGIAGVVCVLAGSVWAVRSHRDTRVQASAPRTEPPLALADGSVVTPLGPSSRLVAKTVSPHLVEMELVSGGAHFEVAPNRDREFRVAAGRVDVTVVGTKFTVERQGERTTVTVQAGRVRVAWQRGEQLLDPGERGVFPPLETAVAPPQPVESPSVETAVQAKASPAHRAADWRSVAEHDPAGAFRMLHDKGKGPSNLDDFLLAADAARSSGHPAEAVRYLERALSLHEKDARSAVVAFTLGRVKLADLHDPAGAAEAFAIARTMAPQGVLAEDALAREVEARYRAGDETGARSLAEEYVRTWPSGSRLRSVRHFGGLP
jgi:transmembrane sensor